ncbi:hypothetical protein ABN309_05665 [Providencia rettgeri]|uniref:hypothetical protein n=1 Tax=Providencia rettgeri TaxID=587 RepID=UPI0032DA34AB
MKFIIGDNVKVKEFDYTGSVKNIDANTLAPYQFEIIEVDWIFTFWRSEDELELTNEI